MAEQKSDAEKLAEAQAKQRADDARKAADAARERADQTPEQRAAEAAADALDAEVKQLDETVEGGRYIVGADAMGKGGTEVNSEGVPLSEKK